MTHEWVKYEEGSAVQKAIAVVNGLEEQGKNIIYMHQGAEETMPSGPLAEFLSYDGHNKSKYNPAKGNVDIKEASAAWVSRYLGIEATAQNTYFVQNNGRSVLHLSAVFSHQRFSGDKEIQVAVPDLRWPMVDGCTAKFSGAATTQYSLEKGNLAASICSRLAPSRTHDVATVYTNLPSNPTGYLSSKEEGTAIIQAIARADEIVGATSNFKTILIDDNPYFASLPQKDQGAFLSAPFEGAKNNGEVPSIHIMSFSKAFGTAQPGATIVTITNDKMAADFGGLLAHTTGPSFDVNNVANIAAMLSADNDDLMKEHLSTLYNKYAANFVHVQKNLGQYLVPGDAGMVCTIRVPNEALNKLVKCVDGVQREIKTARDVAEYIANTHGVQVVDQSTKDEALLRLALKAEDGVVIDEGTHKIAQGFGELQNASKLEPAM